MYQGGGGTKSPFLPPLPPRTSPPSTATLPAPARNTVQRLAEALRLIGTRLAAGEIRSFKSHRLISQPQI